MFLIQSIQNIVSVTVREIVALYSFTEHSSINVQKGLQLVTEKVPEGLDHNILSNKLKILDKRFKAAWKKCYRNREQFERICRVWLNSEFDVNCSRKSSIMYQNYTKNKESVSVRSYGIFV